MSRCVLVVLRFVVDGVGEALKQAHPDLRTPLESVAHLAVELYLTLGPPALSRRLVLVIGQF